VNHRDAIERLALWAANEGGRAGDESLSSHVRGCASCRGWLDTYRWLEDGLRANEPTAKEHPSTAMLALCVTRPEELGELDQRDLDEHLQSCAQCREIVEMVGGAVASARPRRVAAGLGADSQSSSQAPGWKRWLGFAGLAAAAAAVTGMVLVASRWLTTPTGTGSPQSSAAVTELQRAPEHVTGIEVEGRRLIGGEKTLSVSDVQVASGAHVRFRVEESVRFGDGFRIRDGGRLAVEVTGARKSTPR
jgi:hypothetical protein